MGPYPPTQYGDRCISKLRTINAVLYITEAAVINFRQGGSHGFNAAQYHTVFKRCYNIS